MRVKIIENAVSLNYFSVNCSCIKIRIWLEDVISSISHHATGKTERKRGKTEAQWTLISFSTRVSSLQMTVNCQDFREKF